MKVHLAEIEGSEYVNGYDEPMQVLLVEEVSNNCDEELIECHLALKVCIEAGEGVCVIWPRFIVEKCNQHEDC